MIAPTDSLIYTQGPAAKKQRALKLLKHPVSGNTCRGSHYSSGSAAGSWAGGSVGWGSGVTPS